MHVKASFVEEYVWISQIAHHNVFVARAHPVLKRLARTHGVRVTIAGPDDTDLEAYQAAVREAIVRKVAGIMMIGRGHTAEADLVDEALDAGIPVVTVDCDIPRSRRLAHVGTDWYRMGAAMARHLAEMIGGRGKVLMLGILSMANMEAGFGGFRQQLRAYPRIQLVGLESDLDVRPDRAATVAARYLRTHADLAGIAGFDGNSGPGVANALIAAGREHEVALVCVDAESPQIKHLRTGAIDAAMAQKRGLFTYLAFQALYTYNHGSAATNYRPGAVNLPGNVDTGFVVVTRENIDTFEAELSLSDAFSHLQVSQRLKLVSRMVDGSAEIALATDTHGQIIYANPAALRATGANEKVMQTRFLEDLFDLTDAQRQTVTRCLNGGTPGSFETTAIRTDGTKLPVHLSLSPLTAGTTTRGAVVMAADLTERKRFETRQRQLQRRVQRSRRLESLAMLAGGLAHDFNSLLAAIWGNADLALADLPADASARQSVEQIRQAAKRASELTGQLLAASGKGRLATTRVNVNDLVREVAAMLAATLGDKTVLRRELDGDLPAIDADESQIRRVVMNLITNADEALEGRAGEVTVRTGVMRADRRYLAGTYVDDGLPAGPYVWLEVADTGCGIDDASLRRLFEPFYTTKFAGRGLGMAAVLGIIRGHHGAIRLDSRVGQGTTIRVLLPAEDRRDQANEDLAPARQSDGRAVLIVDGEPSVQRVVAAMLDAYDMPVLTAPDGHRAIDLCRRRGGEVLAILVDCSLADMPVSQFAAELREIAPQIEVILCGAHGRQDINIGPKGCAGHRRIQFLPKPLEMDALIAAIRRVGGSADD